MQAEGIVLITTHCLCLCTAGLGSLPDHNIIHLHSDDGQGDGLPRSLPVLPVSHWAMGNVSQGVPEPSAEWAHRDSLCPWFLLNNGETRDKIMQLFKNCSWCFQNQELGPVSDSVVPRNWAILPWFGFLGFGWCGSAFLLCFHLVFLCLVQISAEWQQECEHHARALKDPSPTSSPWKYSVMAQINTASSWK